MNSLSLTERVIRAVLVVPAMLIATSLAIVVVASIRSCDFDQYNDQGGYLPAIGFREVTTTATSEGIRISFECVLENHGVNSMVGYAFVWGEAQGPEDTPLRTMWPEDADYRLPVFTEPGLFGTGGPMDDFKDGYRFELKPGKSGTCSGSMLLPASGESFTSADLSIQPDLLIVLYDVFGYEVMHLRLDESGLFPDESNSGP